MSKLSSHIHTTIESIDQNQWNNVVQQSSLGSIYHRFDWLSTIEEGTSYEPRHITVQKGNSIVGLLPNFLVAIGNTPLKRLVSSLPGFGGPITAGDTAEVLEMLLSTTRSSYPKFVISHDIKVEEAEFTRLFGGLRRRGYRPSLRYCRFLTPLEIGWDDIKRSMHKDRRYALRKADEQRFNVTECGMESNCLDQFYSRYKKSMERVDGVKYPQKFFKLLSRKLDSMVRLYKASVNGSTVGFHIYVLDDQQSMINHLFSGVNKSDFQYYPSELIHRNVIKKGIETDYEYYNYGETLADHEDGIFKYKEKFGGEIQPTPIWRRPIGLSGRVLHRARQSLESEGTMSPFLKRVLSVFE